MFLGTTCLHGELYFFLQNIDLRIKRFCKITTNNPCHDLSLLISFMCDGFYITLLSDFKIWLSSLADTVEVISSALFQGSRNLQTMGEFGRLNDHRSSRKKGKICTATIRTRIQFFSPSVVNCPKHIRK